ncbi:beta-ketoacyl-[acyl-carrier-protein] synthase family protein [Erwinia oleae]|uniref:beta-ketoacyl-[acyl-carrier-protein] synthase family protein n=1 Tax=Erwinia oleae TaxID=796334 RepID=UPI000556B883|nr:beta-ketoacyl-[acyl-carrier-protein] synthase family protein [Erwinia oleae]
MLVKRKRVVITGMGQLSSIASNVPEFKQALLNKTCGIHPSEKYLGLFKDANASEVLQPLDFPGLSEEQIATLDNAALWAYKVGHEALESARLDEADRRAKTALIIGVSSAGTEAFIPLFENQPDRFSLKKAIVCGCFSSCSAIVASLLGLKGGFELLATACTASTNAMGIGFDLIQNGKNSTALVIGTEPIYLPTFAGFYALQAMKPTPTSPFSGTPGMSIGEGAGALLLEEYEHAVARGATIYGEMISYATSGDACHETAPDPRAEGAVQVMNSALANGNLQPADIDYINAHGTGTEANDRCETLAMKKVFPHIAAIPVSSTKSYIGHNIGAAGIIEMVACFLTLADDMILPTLNFGSPRINCDLNYVPNEFQRGAVRLFMKNNYAFGGNNCCVIASPHVGSAAETAYKPRRVAIVGRGMVTSQGHDLSAVFDRLWQDTSPQGLVPLMLDEETIQQFEEMIGNLQENSEMQNFLFERYGDGSEWRKKLRGKTWQHLINGLEPRKYLRRYDPRKADDVGTYALLALTQSMKEAGRKIKRDGHQLGLVLGMSRGPQKRVERYLNSLYPDTANVRTSEFPGSLMNAISTFCSISEGIKGYNTTLATGMNAGLGALTYGYELVRQGLQPEAIVGGADEAMNSFSVYLQSLHRNLMMNESPEAFRVYSDSPAGFFTGEGAGMLFLEDTERATERGATILAEIAGYGRANSTGYFDIDSTEGNAEALACAIRQALTEAQLAPEDISLFCGSSIGTSSSDRAEVNAIRDVFAEKMASTPFVNYNACFGVVESCMGILNVIMVSEIMRRSEILPIPHTTSFCEKEVDFVTERRKQTVETALVLGSTEGGNHYAIVLRKPA